MFSVLRNNIIHQDCQEAMEKITAFLPKGLGSIKENIASCIMDEFACCQLCSQGKESMSDVFREIEITFISSFLLIASYIQMHV